MKKLIFGASMVLIALGYSSCSSGTSATTVQFDIASTGWTASGTSGTSNFLYYHIHSVSAITSSVINNGAVLGYVSTGTYWAALPFTETYSGYSVNYNYSYAVGEVVIIRKDTDLQTIAPSGSITIKIVVLTQKEMPLLDGVDTHNYYEVANALHLEK